MQGVPCRSNITVEHAERKNWVASLLHGYLTKLIRSRSPLIGEHYARNNAGSLLPNKRDFHPSEANMRTKKLRVFADADLEKLKKELKCCIIINDLVYDVSSFYDHPGGYDLFKEYEGKDATASFVQVGHSVNAQQMMKDYLIGIKKNSKLYKKKINKKTVEDSIEYIYHSEDEIRKEEEAKTNKPEVVRVGEYTSKQHYAHTYT
ncbi:cytochrome b5, putative [Plasmodium ovale curtisi]|uniref:Cytochrome b5, putative n=1 Tax=Plasmodium ovale curtisi TaxID=864141 RepID=A0A1A8WL43_PLAOA|nr:cytochrome b5, putative [Plasmodium ovale curtisi]